MNSLSGTIYVDVLKKPLARRGINKEGLVLKILVIIIGIISTLMVYVIENLGGILSVGLTLPGMTYGAILGIYLMGLFFPRANSKVTE